MSRLEELETASDVWKELCNELAGIRAAEEKLRTMRTAWGNDDQDREAMMAWAEQAVRVKSHTDRFLTHFEAFSGIYGGQVLALNTRPARPRPDDEEDDGYADGTGEVLLDNHHGIFIPQMFADEVVGGVPSQSAPGWTGFSVADCGILHEGPDHMQYWDTWDTVLENARYTDRQGGVFWLAIGPCGDLLRLPLRGGLNHA